jgi:hypothetical protein
MSKAKQDTTIKKKNQNMEGQDIHNAKSPAQDTSFHSKEKSYHFKLPESWGDH